MENVGVINFGRGIRLGPETKARGLQHASLGRATVHGTSTQVGTMTFNRPMSVAQRLIARGKGGAVFRSRMGNDTPWYETLFTHIENMTEIASPMVMQILQMSFQQQQAGWAQTSQNKREENYQVMISNLIKTKTGQPSGFDDPKTAAFILKKFAAESGGSRSQTYSTMTGGDPEMSAMLRKIVEGEIPWYQKPLSWVMIGGGTIMVLGLTVAITVAAGR